MYLWCVLQCGLSHFSFFSHLIFIPGGGWFFSFFCLGGRFFFWGGGGLVYFGVMPLALKFFLNMQILDGTTAIRMVNRVSEYLSFSMMLMVAFGLCFQLPIVLMLLGRAGIITADNLRHRRRYAIVIIFALAAIMTPPDIISQIGLGIPLLLLYEASIWGVSWSARARDGKD